MNKLGMMVIYVITTILLFSTQLMAFDYYNPKMFTEPYTKARTPEQKAYRLAMATVVANHVPERYQRAFIYYSDDTPEMQEMRLHFLAIGEGETEWVDNARVTPNQDGSVDLGPMCLNSRNIANKSFMAAYWPSDMTLVKNDTDILYMIVSMKHFSEVWHEIGNNQAINVYNCGINRYILSTLSPNNPRYRELPAITQAYYKRVTAYLQDFRDEFREVYTESLATELKIAKGLKLDSPLEVYLDKKQKTNLFDFGFRNKNKSLPIADSDSGEWQYALLKHPSDNRIYSAKIISIPDIIPEYLVEGFLITGDIWSYMA